MVRKGRIEFPETVYHLIGHVSPANWPFSFCTGSEWSELGSRDIDGQAGRPSERARTSQWLSDLKLYDYRNRMYQPELGHFLQPDPKEFSAGDYNLYRYCHNDPVNRSDPTGLVGEIDNWDPFNRNLVGPDHMPRVFDGYPVALGVALVPAGGIAAQAGGVALLSRVPWLARLVGIGAASGAANKIQAPSLNVKNFVDGSGRVAFSQLTKPEIAQAIGRYQQAADAAKSAVDKAYQTARIAALRGEGPPPGKLLDFAKRWAKENQ